MPESMPVLKFRKLWEDDDSMLQLELCAFNDHMMTTQDFYIYPDEFEGFAADLQSFFPKLGKGEVALEYGCDDKNMYSFVKFVVSYKNISELKIEVETSNNQDDCDLARSHFFLSISNSELNGLGLRLKSWCNEMVGEFNHEWKST